MNTILAVKIKTKAGNDPSSADPLIVRIGGNVRKVTRPLSTTVDAGTLYFNIKYKWYERLPIIGKWLFKLRVPTIDYFQYLPFGASPYVEIYKNGRLIKRHSGLINVVTVS